MQNRIAQNTAWLTFGEVFGRILRAILIVYAARVLGAESWGVFSYVVGLAALFTGLSDIGISPVLTRELVSQPENKERYISTSFFMKLGLIALAVVAMIFLVPLVTKFDLPLAILIGAGFIIIFDSLRLLGAGIVRSAENMKVEALVQLLVQSLILIFGFYVLFTTVNIIDLTAAYAVASAIGLLAMVFILRSYIKPIFTKFNWQLAKKIAVVAGPFAMLGALGGIVLNTDIVMLGWLRNATEIGQYSVAQKIVHVLYIIPALVAAAAFPALTRLANQDKEAFANLLKKALKAVIIIALPISIGGIIIGFELMDLLFGSVYHPAVMTFRILLISLLINYPTTIIGNALFAYNRQKEFVKFTALGAVSNVIFNFALIPQFGIEGAAFSTVLTQLFSNSFIWMKLQKTNPFSLSKELNKVLIANFVLAIFVLGMQLLGIHVIATVTLAVVVYGGLLYLLKEPAFFYLYNMIFKRRYVQH